MEKEAILQWYKENDILDIIDDKPCNHFLLKTDEVAAKPLIQIKKEPQKIKTEITLQNKIQIKTETSKGEKIEFKQEESIKYTIDSKQELNFNSIYQNLANKYKNDNIKTINNSSSDLDNALNEAKNLANNSNTIEQLKHSIENFDGYLDIKKLATNTVFGEGNTKADIMIIGEAPGNNEDLEGRPFCGQSGELLDNMFNSIGIKRENLYITNTLFWRPPGNRTPTEDEIAICKPFVEKHIALINPKFIIFMGSTALKGLIDTPLTITKARKQLFDYTNQYLNGKIIKTTPMFHPSYLLRQLNKKKEAWSDLLFIKNTMKNI